MYRPDMSLLAVYGILTWKTADKTKIWRGQFNSRRVKGFIREVQVCNVQVRIGTTTLNTSRRGQCELKVIAFWDIVH